MMEELGGKIYRAVLFDMDGTLYDQRRLRLNMAIALVGTCLLHPSAVRQLRIISVFRRMREEGGAVGGKDGFEAAQYAAVGEKLGLSPQKVRETVEKWMYQVPLRYLPRCRDERMAALIGRLRKSGTAVIVYSDYPAEEKLAALGLTADGCFSASDGEIACLKPDPRGIRAVLATTVFFPEECLYIGDRDEKDGASARSVGMDYLILPKGRRNGADLFSKIRRPAGTSQKEVR